MIIQQDSSSTRFHINKYEPGKIWINQQIHLESVLISPTDLQTWPVATLADLKIEHFEVLLKKPPKIFILGTGETYQMPDFDLLKELYVRGIGIEVMDSLKAAYTFVVLCSEDREVAAGIILT